MALINAKNRWYWIGGLALVVLLIIAALKGKSNSSGKEVELSKPAIRNISERVQASGKVYPVQEVKISSDVSGEIVQLMVKEGDSVKVGQLLARVNADIYESSSARTQAGVNAAKAQAAQARTGIESAKKQVEQLRAQTEQMAANLETARQNNKRNEQLFKDGVISEQELQVTQNTLKAQEAAMRAAKSAEAVAEASVQQADASTKAAEYNVKGSEASESEALASLKRTNIYAPMSGVVSKLNVEKGERVVGSIQMTGTELMRIANLSSMEVQVDVNENEVMRLKNGNTAEIDIDAYPGRKFKGVVTEIARTASNASLLNSDQVTNFVVRILLDPTSYADLSQNGAKIPFLPGMSATADIYTQSVENVIALPIAAVAQREKAAFTAKKKESRKEDDETLTVEKTIDDIRIICFVKSGDTVRMADVVTGIQDDEYIQIISGIKAEDQVVIGPYNLVARELEEGDKVTKKEKAKADKKKS